MNTHLVNTGDATWTPCVQCRRTLWQMNVSDEFTLSPAEATCEPVA